ncbi:MAG: hypothetical protein RMK75_06975 [Aquificaceae bacterium]|nr:hypothetical protein [Aquificaceae bacterium]MDW8424044.1 hypothetical protein [Aquificaceae bacterium]
MRFFISSDIKRNKPLYAAVLMFLLFALFFWLASWVHFYTKYTFSTEGLIRYYFMDPEFPEKISISQISEDFHVSLFLHGVMLITLFSLFNLTSLREKVRIVAITLTSLLAILYIASDFPIIFLGTSFVLLKFVSFVAYQMAFLTLLLLTLVGIHRNNSKPPRASSLKAIVFIFSLFSLFFVLSNFLNFHSKMGFGIQGIRDYFLGNPELFIKGKSFEGLYKVFYPHLIAMAVYSLVVAHLLPFGGIKRRLSLFFGVSLFVFSFFDNLSSLFILLDPNFAYLKLISFLFFQTTALVASFIILTASLRKESYPGIYL